MAKVFQILTYKPADPRSSTDLPTQESYSKAHNNQIVLK